MALVWLLFGAVLGHLATEFANMRASSRRHRKEIAELKADQDRFSVVVLMAKAKVASVLAERLLRYVGDDGEVLEELCKLYDEVANHPIPDDAAEQFHELKAKAAQAARAGRPVVLRVLH